MSRLLALLSLIATPVLATPALAQVAQRDTAVFAGGCFWGVQAVFQHVKGVVTATSGYSGGPPGQTSYAAVSSGTSGHAEAVRVIYDPAQVPFNTLLDVFFKVAHDPTELNRQGPDEGPQYRSAVFYTSDAQHRALAAYIVSLQRSGAVRKPVVTQVQAFKSFHTAEAYHQDYATLHPNDRYIVYNDAPKIEALKRQYPSLWSDRLAGH